LLVLVSHGSRQARGRCQSLGSMAPEAAHGQFGVLIPPLSGSLIFSILLLTFCSFHRHVISMGQLRDFRMSLRQGEPPAIPT
jgi:hypothetical protein